MILETNSNSWRSCFQFHEKPGDAKPHRRFKVYCKTLQQLQSLTPWKALGMNTNALFNPQPRIQKAIEETWEEGLTRLEISYYFPSAEAEQELMKEDFCRRALQDLDAFHGCLNSLKGVCYLVPMTDILKYFQELARPR